MRRILAIVTVWVLILPQASRAAGDEFEKYRAAFNNFVTCELTRTDATDHFKGQPFKITMINLHQISRESGLKILTGAVQCQVREKYVTLFPAVGVETVVDKEQVTYYVIRDREFSILASELYRYPYQERCPWARHWIKLD